MRRSIPLIGSTLILLALVAGCAAALPSGDTVRQEARDVTDEVVALLPTAEEVVDLSTETPFGCQPNGVIYTAHLAVYPGDEFDGESFIANLPAELGDEWVVDTGTIETSTPQVTVRAEGMSLNAAVVDDDGRVAVDVLVLSRCGEEPTDQDG